MAERVTIDGSYGEGGGQIIRTSVSLAALTGREVEIRNVRARRSRPGLQAQHLTAVRAAASLCGATLHGAEAGSTTFVFRPEAPVSAGHYRFDIGTAGATNLVAQTVLAPLAHQSAPSRVVITGGTHVPHAPSADYLGAVYLPMLRRAGLQAAFVYPRAGFFPKGGGELDMTVPGAVSASPLDLSDRGRLKALTAYVVTANLPDHVADRGAAAIEKFMKGIGREVRMEKRRLPALDAGAAVCLAVECENGFAGFTGLGERGKPMEKVAERPCEEFIAWWKSGAAVDVHLGDQLVLPMALAPGESRWTTPAVTDHLRTVLWLVEQFLPIGVELEELREGPVMVRLHGAPLA